MERSFNTTLNVCIDSCCDYSMRVANVNKFYECAWFIAPLWSQSVVLLITFSSSGTYFRVGTSLSTPHQPQLVRRRTIHLPAHIFPFSCTAKPDVKWYFAKHRPLPIYSKLQELLWQPWNFDWMHKVKGIENEEFSLLDSPFKVAEIKSQTYDINKNLKYMDILMQE